MTAPPDGVDVAVVGAGVVGAAVAARLTGAGASVAVLEQGPRAGEGISSRNSGVVHSGLYYPVGSLKAQSCVRGQALLYGWAAQHGVWHSVTGKLVVATTEAQVAPLEALAAHACRCGAPGVELVTAARARELEPALGPVAAALWCPRTGIVDAAELVQSLISHAVAGGAWLLTHAEVTALQPQPAGWLVSTRRGPLHAAAVINAAGLSSDRVARMAGVDRFTIHPWRGDYFSAQGAPPVRRLIYPVKQPGAPGLGIHLTLDRGGRLRLGPDVEPAAARDDFRAAPDKVERFAAALERLMGPWPGVRLHHDGVGIRPKLRSPADQADGDFVIHEEPAGCIHLVGIESPGLTACLDLADRVAERLGKPGR